MPRWCSRHTRDQEYSARVVGLRIYWVLAITVTEGGDWGGMHRRMQRLFVIVM